MQALVHEKYGGPEVLQVVNQFPVPECGKNDVLIKVHAAAINPVDYKMLGGMTKLLPNMIKKKPEKGSPAPIGFDVSGVVTEVGSGVKSNEFQVGQEVFAMADFRRTGSIAEYFAISKDLVAVKPKNINHVEAASLPLVSLTNYQALFYYGQLQPKQKVLILGGSGGTGTNAIQLAHDAGAFVATTCSQRNADFVKSLGADLVIDYTKENFADVLEGKDYDVVYDCVGGAQGWEFSQKVLAKTGKFVTIVGDVADSELGISSLLRKGFHIASRQIGALFGCNPKYYLFTASTNAPELQKISALVEAGKLKPIIDSTYTLNESKKAFEKQMSSRSRGKLVIQLI